MLSETLQNAINEQIKNEFYSAYLYLAMSAHFEEESLPGFANWTRIQAQEEVKHAMKFFDFVLDRNAHIDLRAFDKPPAKFGTPLEVFKMALEHEQKVTGMINNLYAAALKENDYAAQVLLQWYVTEQVEEEKNATLIVEQLKMLEGRQVGLINYDRHIGKREAGE